MDEWQDHVYQLAHKVVQDNRFNTILDIGCGSGFKLMKYFSDYPTTGLEVEPALTFVKEKYPTRIWYRSDFTQPITSQWDMVICADVIEHLPNPDELLDFISGLTYNSLIISTPDRHLLQSLHQERGLNGPPVNIHHCREWTSEEFEEYIGKRFNIIDHHSHDPEWCQVVVCAGSHISNKAA